MLPNQTTFLQKSQRFLYLRHPLQVTYLECLEQTHAVIVVSCEALIQGQESTEVSHVDRAFILIVEARLHEALHLLTQGKQLLHIKVPNVPLVHKSLDNAEVVTLGEIVEVDFVEAIEEGLGEGLPPTD